MKKEEAQRLFNDLRQDREVWVSAWKEIGRYLAPNAGSFEQEAQTKRGRQIDHKVLLDSSPLMAVEILSSGMVSGLTSPSRPWFELTLDGKIKDQSNTVKRWLYDVKQTIENVFAKSNVYWTLHRFYQEIAVFGTAAFLLEENYDTVVHARALTIGEFMLGENEFGKIDRFGREFYMTAWQLVNQFGLDSVPQSVKQNYLNKEFSRTYKVRHLIAPNTQRKTGRAGNKNMPFSSVYFMDGQNGFLRESGYEDFPVIAARWELYRPSDVYGRAPGWNTLGDVKMLQKLQKTKLVALDKMTNPPLMVSSAVQGEVNLTPGGITRYSSTADASVKPVYQVTPDLQSLEYTIEKTQNQIARQFFADMFLMISNVDAGKMTATEVAERTQEKMMMLGPVLERLKNELLDPLIERTFNVCLRAGILPPPPEEIQGRELHVSYISMIAQAQNAAALNTIRQGFSFAAELADANPSVMDNLDFDGALREGLAAIGATPKMIRAEEDVQNSRLERAKAQQAAQQQAQLAQALQSAKTLADTPLNTGSALDAVAKAGGVETNAQ